MKRDVTLWFLLSYALLAAFVNRADAARNYPPQIEGATEVVYKSVDDVDLKLWMFAPEGADSEAFPAMLFFFGGGWTSGSPEQFVHQAKYLSARGMVGIVVDYRVKSRHGVQAVSCVEDAWDALRFIKNKASELGVDPDRVGVGGGSAGGHLAACLGTIYASEPDAPDALALFNPATVLAPIEWDLSAFPRLQSQLDQANAMIETRQPELEQRLGVPTAELSPFSHVEPNTPPTVIFHGTEDRTTPYLSAVLFEKRLQAAQVEVYLMTYKGAGHGFFNQEPYRSQTTQQLDDFLESLGWLR